jgi:hypothetical protein
MKIIIIIANDSWIYGLLQIDANENKDGKRACGKCKWIFEILTKFIVVSQIQEKIYFM